MKHYLILVTLLLFFSSSVIGQDMKVKWEDEDGREFSIRVLSGTFNYSMVPGDDIEYDIFSDKVKQIGDVIVRYSIVTGKVVEVGDVTIRYDMFTDVVEQVGGLSIKYDLFGKIKGTRGEVR